MKEMIYGLPVVALRGTSILPEMIVHFDVSRPRSVKAVEAAMLKEQKVFLVTQKDLEKENPGLLDFYKVGTVAYIKQIVKLPDDVLRVLVEGLSRGELLRLERENPYLEGQIGILRKKTLRIRMSKRQFCAISKRNSIFTVWRAEESVKIWRHRFCRLTMRSV